jgi:hypothetical protein
VGAVSFKARVIMRQGGLRNQKPEIRNQNQTASPKLQDARPAAGTFRIYLLVFDSDF